MNSPAIVSITAVMSLLVSGCGSKDGGSPVRHGWEVMGTFAAVSVPAEETENTDLYSATARSVMEEVNRLVTVYSADSEISKLNQAAGTGAGISISPITEELLKMSVRYGKMTEGSFDVTIFPLIQLWGFNGGDIPATIPAPATIDEARARTGYGGLKLDHGFAELTDEATIDLGGIAKGYAVDICYDRIMTNKPTGVMIDLGGNIRCGGYSRKRKPWRIGVRNPFNRSELIGVVELTGGLAIATSGNYERFVDIEGKRYAHIIDPRTGYPVQGMAGVTVLSKTAVEADALSTAFFVLGIKASANILKTFPDSQVLLVPDKQPMEIHVSRGLKKYFQVFPEYKDSVIIMGE